MVVELGLTWIDPEAFFGGWIDMDFLLNLAGNFRKWIEVGLKLFWWIEVGLKLLGVLNWWIDSWRA